MPEDDLSPLWRDMRSVRLSKVESARLEAKIMQKAKNSVREGETTCLDGMDPRFFLRTTAKSVRLSSEDDAEIFGNVMRFARENPTTESPNGFLEPGETLLGKFTEMWYSPIFLLRPLPIVAAFMLFVVCTTGISMAADSALPGDVLYPVKVNFNEQAEAALQFSGDSRARFEVGRLEKRLEEATQLAASGRLSAALKASVSDRINAQLTLTQQAAAALGDNGAHDAALDVHSQIESDLVANAAVLASIINNSGSTVSGVKGLLQDVSDAEHAVAQVRLKKERNAASAPKLTQQSQAEHNMQLAMARIQDAETFLNANRSGADSHIMMQSDARLTFAKRMFSNARTQIDSKDYELAIKSTGEALRAAMEAKTMLRIAATVSPSY